VTETRTEQGVLTRVCSLDDLPEVGAVCVEIDGLAIAVVRESSGAVHAIDDTCTHENNSLSEGEVEDGEVECWLHGSRFDLRSGAPTGLPATRPVRVYPVKVEDGDVFVGTEPVNPPATGK
jgi:3-phenylpropionate/trans-cinnamate dioxygenase ferredoxin subunit